jgi:hypothetical protein
MLHVCDRCKNGIDSMTLKNDARKMNAKISLANTLFKLNLMPKTTSELESLKWDRMQLLRRLSQEEWREYLKESARMKERL